MILMNPSLDRRMHELAIAAADHFRAHPRSYTFQWEDAPEAGQAVALRWNECTIMVLRLDDLAPRLYSTSDMAISTDLPPLVGDATLRDKTADHDRVVELEAMVDLTREHLHAVLDRGPDDAVGDLAHLVEWVRLKLKAQAEAKLRDASRIGTMEHEAGRARRAVHELRGFGRESRPNDLQEGLHYLGLALHNAGVKLEGGRLPDADSLRLFLDLSPVERAGLLELRPIVKEIRSNGHIRHSITDSAVDACARAIHARKLQGV